MTDPMLALIMKKQAQELQAKIDASSKLSPLEKARQQAASRAIVTGESPMPRVDATPTTPVAKTVDMSREDLEEMGWDAIILRLGDYGLTGIGSGSIFTTMQEGFSVSNDVVTAAKQVCALKGGKSTRIKMVEREYIRDFIRRANDVCDEVDKTTALENEKRIKEEARAAKKAALDAEEAERKVREMRYATVDFMGEHGTLYMNGTTLKLCVASVQRGVPLLLIGEPGSGKTDIARSVPALADRRVFHLDVTGLSDVAQIEAERYIENVGGVSVTVSKPTALIEALEAAEAGEKVCLVIDEIARTVDPSILNPLLLLLSHGEYHATVGKKTYRVNRDNFTVIATANIDAGRNFSGNNRRGLDDALVDRFRIIRIPRAESANIGDIIWGRVKAIDTLPHIVTTNMIQALTFLYASATSPEQRRIITTRSIIGVADAWVSLDPRLYSLPEVVKLELQDRTADESTLSGLVTLLEQKGF